MSNGEMCFRTKECSFLGLHSFNLEVMFVERKRQKKQPSSLPACSLLDFGVQNLILQTSRQHKRHQMSVSLRPKFTFTILRRRESKTISRGNEHPPFKEWKLIHVKAISN